MQAPKQMRISAADERASGLTVGEWLRRVREYWRQDKLREAVAAAWAAFDLAEDDRDTRWLLSKLLRAYPAELLPERRAAFLRLLIDPDVEPNTINTAGWDLLLRSYPAGDDAGDAEFAALAAALEGDQLALALLCQAPVGLAAAEQRLTKLRRWLLLSRQWDRTPALLTALQAQARLNGGAWPFDEEERAQLGDVANSPMLPAYLPPPPNRPDAAIDAEDPTTRAVTAQYEGWPYPAWTRITRQKPTRLPDMVRSLDPALAALLPTAANILVAGCGTGRQAAAVALQCPDAAVTAIDVSAASLDYARRQCAAYGIANVRFVRLDLHQAPTLGERFHAIHCSGVLHHLPDPVRGWGILSEVLAPAGVMRIMVYNKIARLRILGARKLLGDLMQKPIDDDLLRQVRGRILQQREHPLAAWAVRSPDFATLAGTHDLLLHRHEDPFDLPGIERALARLRLRLLSFDLPTPVVEARYDAKFPHDRDHRDIKSWINFIGEDMGASWGNFNFWCGRVPAAAE